MVLLKSVNRKQSLGLLVLILSISFISACASMPQAPKSSPETAGATGKVYQIKVEGMHCKMCVNRVTKSLKKLKEVREVEVDLDEGTATVLLNDGADVKPEALEEAVKDSGYNPTGIKELK